MSKLIKMERKQLKILSQRIENEPRKFIQVLYGPRQVGKTTMVRQLLDKTKIPSHFATADTVTMEQGAWIAQQWEAARIKCRASKNQEVILIIDEVQKIHNWSEQVKLEWDQDSGNRMNVKVILLGSSRLLLQQGLTESLTGRFETMYLPHWSFAEMKALHGVTLEQYIWFGGYPGAAILMEDEVRWKAYMQTSIIETSISRDILMLTRVDKPALIKRLFETGCAYSGQILSLNKIIGQLHDAGNTTTLAHYLELLDQAGLLSGLQKYSPKVLRQRASSPKFQVHNTGLMSAMVAEHFNEVVKSPDRWGRWVESAVGAHLINQCRVHNFQLHYWRQQNDEIDFVIEGNGKVIGLEVKSGFSGKASGMEAFKKEFKPDKVLLVGKSGMGVGEFLEMEIGELLP